MEHQKKIERIIKEMKKTKSNRIKSNQPRSYLGWFKRILIFNLVKLVAKLLKIFLKLRPQSEKTSILRSWIARNLWEFEKVVKIEEPILIPKKIEDVGKESTIHWNGPPVYLVEALEEKALNRVFKGRPRHSVTKKGNISNIIKRTSAKEFESTIF